MKVRRREEKSVPKAPHLFRREGKSDPERPHGFEFICFLVKFFSKILTYTNISQCGLRIPSKTKLLKFNIYLTAYCELSLVVSKIKFSHRYEH